MGDRIRFSAIKKSMLGRRVLSSHHPSGIAQEIYALLTVYQALRIAITDATTASGADPDRASFSISLQTARGQVIHAAEVIADTVIDLIGAIGRAVLDQLMPARRLRISPRAVKRPLSRYAYKSLRVDRRTYPATIEIDILTPTSGPNFTALALGRDARIRTGLGRCEVRSGRNRFARCADGRREE